MSITGFGGRKKNDSARDQLFEKSLKSSKQEASIELLKKGLFKEKFAQCQYISSLKTLRWYLSNAPPMLYRVFVSNYNFFTVKDHKPTTD